MVFESNKPDKECPHCKKIVKNLGMHVIKNHPAIFAKIDDSPINEITTPDKKVIMDNNLSNPSVYRGSINDLIKEKLDTMLNLKIVEMLSKGASITDVTNTLNPQKNGINLEELKIYKELFVNNSQPQINIPVADNGSEWLSLVNNSLPIVTELLKNRKTESITNDTEYRQPETRDIDNSRPIQSQITRDSKESNIPSEKSGIIIPTE